MSKKFIYQNEIFDKKQLRKIILWSFTNYGITTVSTLVDSLKELGFFFATKAGLSLSLEDLKIPPEKLEILNEAYSLTEGFNIKVNRAELTEIERFQQVINNWNQTSEDLKDHVINYFKYHDPLNPIYIMAFSGARGNISQVRQLVGMRGLMADPNGEIIDLPIVTNFREGLKITDYLISSFGARKGLVDTALKTADSGYLTRRLVDVAQDILIRESFCGTNRGIQVNITSSKTLNEQLAGRILAEKMYFKNNLVLDKGTELTFEILDQLAKKLPFKIYVFSSLTCKSIRSICQTCYGWNLATNKLVRLGEAVGVLAAQSIGEPGTQLTMRTFHTGGVFTGSFDNQIRAQSSGKVLFSASLKFSEFRTDLGNKAYKVIKRGNLFLKDYKNDVKTINLKSDSIIYVKNLAYVKNNNLIGQEPSKSDAKAITTKELKSKNTGRIYIDKKFLSRTNKLDHESVVVWVFDGQLSQIPISSNLLLKQKKNLKNEQLLLHLKITQNFSKRLKSKSQNKTLVTDFQENINLLKSLKLRKSNLPDVKNQLIVFSKLFDLNLCLEEVFSSIKDSIKSTKQLKSAFLYDGKLCFYQTTLLFHKTKINKNANKSGILKPALIFATKKSQISTKLLLPKSFSLLILIQDHKGQLLKSIKMKNLRDYHIKRLNSFDRKVLYKGETLISNIEVLTTSLVEKFVLSRGKNVILCVQSLETFRIAKYKLVLNNFVLNLNYNLNSSLPEKTINHLLCPDLKLETLNDPFFKFFITKIKIILKQETHQLMLVLSKATTIKPKISERKSQDSYSLIEEKQLIELNSILNIYGLAVQKDCYIETIQLKKRNRQKLLLFFTTTEDTFTIHTETSNKFFFKKGDFIKRGDYLNLSLTSGVSGKVIFTLKNKLIISKASAYLLSKKAFLFLSNNDFVEKNENLGVFLFEKTTTGDIVQGLPKVEEILEARKISSKGRLLKDFGLFLEESTYFIRLRKPLKNSASKRKQVVHFFQLVFLTKEELKVYRRIQTSPKNLMPGNFVQLNFLIKDGTNLHKLLYNYYKYFSPFNSIYESCYRSLKKIQVLIITSIQQVYESQNVSISDKHIELIVRQMSSKVQISHVGETMLRCGDIVELESVDYINKSISYFHKSITTYIPVLHGITRSSLKTDSFISAASFQETTKVLTDATVEGKIDWLKGLKENVIVGRLIPAGTGFNIYNNLNDKKNLPFSIKTI